jgi:hypothetical protein
MAKTHPVFELDSPARSSSSSSSDSEGAFLQKKDFSCFTQRLCGGEENRDPFVEEK